MSSSSRAPIVFFLKSGGMWPRRKSRQVSIIEAFVSSNRTMCPATQAFHVFWFKRGTVDGLISASNSYCGRRSNATRPSAHSVLPRSLILTFFTATSGADTIDKLWNHGRSMALTAACSSAKPLGDSKRSQALARLGIIARSSKSRLCLRALASDYS